MKKLLLVPFLFIALQTWAQHTAVFRPHFNGEESSPFMIDNLCNPNQNYANDTGGFLTEFICSAWTYNGCPGYVRHMIRFTGLSDTSIIPANAVITSAKLYLYGIPNSNLNYGNSYYPTSPYPDSNNVWVFELNDSFSRQTSTWNNQPQVRSTTGFVEILPSHSHWNENDTIDVTSMVADMIEHGNTGFIFELRNEIFYRQRMWATNMYPDTSLHPMLIVNYDISNGISNVNKDNSSINIYPDPVQTQLNMDVSLQYSGTMNIVIYDITGKLIYNQPHSFNTGKNSIAIPVNNYRPGVYSLTISDGTRTYKKMFTKI